MTDRPIIFSPAMTRALLAGRKTQTRRLATSPLARCAAGDRLWVREAFALDDNGHEEWPVFKADGVALPSLPPSRAPSRWRPSIHMPRWASRLTLHVEAVRVERLQDISEADATAEGLRCLSKDYGRVWKWGLPDSDDGLPGTGADGWTWQMWCVGHRPAFAKLWDSLHGQEAWAANPHVVALTFRVEGANIDAVTPAGAP